MSFRCGFCGEAQPRYIKPVKVVTKIRDKGGKITKRDASTTVYDPRYEIVQEVLACPKCAKIPVKPEVVEAK